MEWVYNNQQKGKEIFSASLERFTVPNGIGIWSQSIIREAGKLGCQNMSWRISAYFMYNLMMTGSPSC